MLFSSSIFLIGLSLVPNRAKGQAVYRQSDGDPFIRDGIVNLVGFSGTVFQVINYMPVCGILSSSLTRHSDLSEKCTSAMSSFNTSSATSGIYDISGVASTELPGSGTQLCVCGSFGTSTAKAGDPKSKGLLCVWVDEKGVGEEWWSLYTETRVASSFQLSAQGKSLPRCNDVDISSIKADSLATRTAASSSAASQVPPTTTSSGNKDSSTARGSSTLTGDTSTNTARVPSSNGGNNTAIIAGSVVGGVAVVILIVALIGLRKNWFKKDKGNKEKDPFNSGPGLQ